MRARDAERRFYNRFHASETGTLTPHERARLAAITRALERDVARSVAAPRAILDLGCGNGWLAGRLAPWGAVTGIDLADEAVSAAARRYPGLRFVCADLTAVPLRDRTFDVVVCSEVIEHVQDQPALVALIARLLRPGGVLILTCPNQRAARHWWSHPRSRRQPREAWLTREEIRALLRPWFEVLRDATFVGDYLGWGFPGRRSIRGERWIRRGLRALRVDALRAAMGRGLYIVTCARRRSGGPAEYA